MRLFQIFQWIETIHAVAIKIAEFIDEERARREQAAKAQAQKDGWTGIATPAVTQPTPVTPAPTPK